MPEYRFSVTRREYNNGKVSYIGDVNPDVISGREHESREKPNLRELVYSFFSEGLLFTDQEQLLTIDKPIPATSHTDYPIDKDERNQFLGEFATNVMKGKSRRRKLENELSEAAA